MRFSLCQDSRIGRVNRRKARAGYTMAGDALLLLMAEGEGDPVAADMAAVIASQALGARFQQSAKAGLIQPELFLPEGFQYVQQEVQRYQQINPLTDVPRLSLLACLIQQDSACWAWIGSNRLLWLRDGSIIARNRAGREGAADRHGLEAPAHRRPDVSRRARLQRGDVILLGSSAIGTVLPDHCIANGMKRGDVSKAIPEMLDAAVGMEGKNSDNVTALAIRWGECQEEQEGSAQKTLTGAAMIDQSARHADPTRDVFNETEIERAIEEIRGAIAKSSR